MKFGLAVIYLYKDGPSPNMGINFASGVFGEVIIKLTYHVKPRGVFSISSGTIRLIRANQEFDTGNICVENWLTICNNLLMDHQQHYWYIKNSSRALQNTNNSIYLLNNPLSLVGSENMLIHARYFNSCRWTFRQCQSEFRLAEGVQLIAQSCTTLIWVLRQF